MFEPVSELVDRTIGFPDAGSVAPRRGWLRVEPAVVAAVVVAVGAVAVAGVRVLHAAGVAAATVLADAVRLPKMFVDPVQYEAHPIAVEHGCCFRAVAEVRHRFQSIAVDLALTWPPIAVALWPSAATIRVWVTIAVVVQAGGAVFGYHRRAEVPADRPVPPVVYSH